MLHISLQDLTNCNSRCAKPIHIDTSVMRYEGFHGNNDSSRYQHFHWNGGNHVSHYTMSWPRTRIPKHDYSSCDYVTGFIQLSVLTQDIPLHSQSMYQESSSQHNYCKNTVWSYIKLPYDSTLKGHPQARMCEGLVVAILTLHFHERNLFFTIIYYNNIIVLKSPTNILDYTAPNFF